MKLTSDIFLEDEITALVNLESKARGEMQNLSSNLRNSQHEDHLFGESLYALFGFFSHEGFTLFGEKYNNLLKANS